MNCPPPGQVAPRLLLLLLLMMMMGRKAQSGLQCPAFSPAARGSNPRHGAAAGVGVGVGSGSGPVSPSPGGGYRDVRIAHVAGNPTVAMATLLALAALVALTTAVEPEWHFNTALCRYALGMQDGSIPDEDIKASSSWSDSTEAKHGRLSSGEGDGAWCPGGSVYPHSSEFLQVDLRRLHFVTLVGTQGRHANGHGKEFARSYRLRYSRDGRTWLSWRDRWGEEVVSGNQNTYDVVLKDLGPPIIARLVRFYPMADRVMSVCLRVELYGCPWTGALKAYTVPEGQVMHLSGSPVYLNDSTYDGTTEAGIQYGGLGQLCDGVLGADDFMDSQELRVWPGYDYLGWNREATGKGHVEMEFHFQTPRTLHSMQVRCNNRYAQGVRVFSRVQCQFKPGLLHQWDPEPLGLAVALDDLLDPSARTVTVPLGGRRGAIVRCQFSFADSWLLISEIAFQSEEAEELPLPEDPPPPSTTAGSTSTALTPGGAENSTTLPGADWVVLTPKAGLPVAKDDSSHTSILVGCLVAIILLLLGVIASILWRQHWRKLLGKAQGQSHEELRVHLSVPGDTVVINNTHNPLGSARYSSRYQRIQSCAGEPDREEHSPGEYQEPSVLLRQREATARPLSNLLLPSSHSLTPAGDEGSKPINTQAAGGRGYSEAMAPPLQEAPPPYPGAPPPPSVPHYAEADIVSLQGVSGNNAYAVPALAAEDSAPAELPRACLVFREKLGEGQFGEVHLCEIHSPQELPGLEFPFNIRKGRPLLVAVKILRADATKNARNDFLKEVKILWRLKDPNIIRLLGVCVRDDPLCMVTEYMESGDLNQYLSHRSLEDKATASHGESTVSYTSLISMACQISSGMKFLASLNFVHRDLATRNCLVGEGGAIKIADFGMSRNLYAGDYYRIQGRAVLPIRWMAWECILMGKFTTASDVWAFGVTLWEMLRLCKEQPYASMTDELVIENAGEFFRDQGKQVYLSRPEVCPQGLYELMLSCWSRESRERPSFPAIHRFLLEDAMNMV
ncbi:epithelial discoidin domain-containing receptor 1 isoform X3 [Lepisosteus oculatus]|uniref:epithelial discoidin domain-containing receptor 1 isoform X3 n=1 Tax=Lepisosteus oculatus TaxID=7918 RepID=UPI0035F50566